MRVFILACVLLTRCTFAQPSLDGPTAGTFNRPASSVSTNLLTNLIAYYKLDDAANGTRVDSVNSLNLTDGAANISSTAGIINNCADANGNNGELTNADNALYQVGGNQDFTFQVWFNVGGSLLGTQVFINKGLFTGSGDEYGVELSSSKPTFFVGNGSTFGQATWGSTISDSSWHQLIAWYDHTAQTVNIVIDNGTVVSSSWTGGTQSTTGKCFALFDNSAIGGFHYTRKMDEVGFWKRVLTSSEITALWNSGAALPFGSFGSTP